MNELLQLREYITGYIKVLYISLAGTKIQENIIEQIAQVWRPNNLLYRE